MNPKGKDKTGKFAINRRNFIKIAAGGVVGAGLSPLPWKLMDDTAIFTQNLPWVPVPQTGEFTHIKSICTLCPGGCGISVRKAGERAVKIEGRTDYPVNQRGLCPLGMGGLQLLYNEQNRFTGPMKRTGTERSGIFTSISWKDAIRTLALKLSDLRSMGKADSIVAVDGNPAGSTMSVMIERFMKSIGSPNYMRMPSSEGTHRIVTEIMYGKPGSVAYDLENSDYILSFGSGLLEGWGSPVRVLNAWDTWRSGIKGSVKIVQIESRVSDTASKADKWIAAAPGTEAALALGLAHVMIKEDLCDNRFLSEYCSGFLNRESSEGTTCTGFKDYVLQEYSPEKVSAITKVKVDDIMSTARDFANAKSPLAVCGRGKGILNGSVMEYMAIHALNALTGSLNRPGGLIVHNPLPLNPLPDVVADDFAQASLKNSRIDSGASGIFSTNQGIFENLADRILMNSVPEVNIMLIFSSNPAFTLPDGGTFCRAMKKIPYIVSFSPFRDESALMADLVLPDHTFLEKIDDVVLPAGIQYPLYGLTEPVMEPLYDTKHSGDVIIDIAGNMGEGVSRSFPWKRFEDVLKERAKGLNIQWKRLRERGFWHQSVSFMDNTEGLFSTETGKFEFFNNKIEKIIEASGSKFTGLIPAGDEAAIQRSGGTYPEKDSQSYPLKMVPYELIYLSSGWLPNPPYLNKIIYDNQLLKNESFVEINPLTATEFNLKQGDRVYVESSAGKIQARINIFEGAMPGIVFMPMGFGHTAYDDFTRGKGVNPNDIIAGVNDPVSGHPLWWNTKVRLTKVNS